MQIYPKTEDSDTSLWCIIWLWCQNNNIIIIIVLCVEPFVDVHFFLMSITYQNTRECRHPFVWRQFEGCLILLWIDNAFRNSLENILKCDAYLRIRYWKSIQPLFSLEYFGEEKRLIYPSMQISCNTFETYVLFVRIVHKGFSQCVNKMHSRSW